ncbi:poly-beta-1,6-N-acetyl-D-glucosamine biosynthesis protein PgaD [Massilia sp. TS11]|uniref:poly-beta-1,6-N-acetyl-D-glucosamine biosynthesis protein PgaD n=1 Tax=Massilia sp. TS11 TaxID=2908003 RepID=UPI001EDA7D9F|nr:poly-beta-1,6-N-acetyl-D-glucosamine biosynthesis protein PgaD [Massilia sp. TS11]MCG2586079.1 poly-beta-1,6-N-acetyl-D-glucosamine biosynthesis protein PgaD [Massilia sp. TS11]
MNLPKHIRVTTQGDDSLIFEKGFLQERELKAMMYALNCFGWGIWIYLWRPIATGLGWLIGLDSAGKQWMGDDAAADLADFANSELPIGLALCGALLTWATVHYWRQARRDGAAKAEACIHKDAAKTRVTADKLGAARAEQALVCDYDQHGILVAVAAH